MSRLSAFLHPAAVQETKEVIISRRFKDEKGEPAPFVIKALSQAENEEIGKQCKRGRDGEPDNTEYTRRIVVAATVEPDFANKELLAALSPNPDMPLLNPLKAPGRMLLAGEYAKLVKEIMEFSGFDEDLVTAAKN